MCSGCSGSSPSAISRQEFLKLSGAGVAGAAFLGLLGSGSVLAQMSSPLKDEFSEASEKYGVPAELMLAVGYANTRWEMPPPETGDYEPENIHGMGGYGIMHLRQDPDINTLGKAAELTGLSEEEIKTDRRANVLGGAAVLANAQGEPKPDTLNGWYDTVARFGTGPLYANQVYETLKNGASSETSSGEEITLSPQEDAEPQRLFTTQATADYGGATWYGAYGGNYTNASRPGSNPINKVIVHVVQGSWSSAINWFQDSRAGVSAHYTVRSSDGFIGQSVREADIAYHAGYWPYNQTSIGIEHEGYVSEPSWFTDRMYRSSAKLSAYLCKKYKIPIDRNHIIGHYEVPGCSGPGGGSGCHTDPGPNWNWGKYMDLVRYYAGAATQSKPSYTQVVDNRTSGRFRASSSWVRSTYHSSTDRGTDYRVLKKPSSAARNAAFKVRIPSKGRYVIQAWWPGDAGYNPRTTFMVRTSSGWVRRRVDQRTGGRWVSLGTYDMDAGDNWWVAVSCMSRAKGYIIADAVRVVSR